MGIANIINTAGGGGGGGSEIITHLVNSVDGAGLRLANSASIKCNDVAANRFGTADFSIELVISQNAESVNSDIFTSSADYSTPSNPQAKSAALIRWDVSGNGNLSLVFFNSTGTGTTYDFGVSLTADVDKPTHFVVSADRSANAVLFRNGAEVASVDISASSSENIGVGGYPAVVGLPNTLGFKGNIYRLRTYSKLLSSDEAKNVFDRADVPTALVSNLLLDLDCAYANPTQSTVIQDRGPNNQDGTLNGTITQTNVIKQLNSVSARIGTFSATPADGRILVDGGAVGSPAYSFGHTTATGMYSLGANKLNFSTASTERLALDGSGNVSIAGAADPYSLSGDGAVNQLSVHATGTNKSASLNLASTGTGWNGISLGNEAIRRAFVGTLNGSHLVFYTNNTNSGTTVAERLRIAATGLITATSQIQVTSSNVTGVAFSVGDAGTGWYNTGSNAIGLATNGEQRINVSNGGLCTFNNGITVKGANNWSHISASDSQSLTLADDAEIQLADSEAGSMLMHIYDRGTGYGALVFAAHGGQPILLADPSGVFAVSDTDNKYCVYKSSGSHDVFFKNRSGGSKNFCILVTAGVLDDF